jgi:uncharacterized protein YdeI (BOF family)
MKNLILATALIAVAAPVAAQSITPIANAERGTMVVLQGTVDRITDEDEFHLRDATGWIEIDVGDDWVPVDVGEQITVQGFVDDDWGPLEVYARSLTRADGTVIAFDRHHD